VAYRNIIANTVVLMMRALLAAVLAALALFVVICVVPLLNVLVLEIALPLLLTELFEV
jgi:hypothetical protein